MLQSQYPIFNQNQGQNSFNQINAVFQFCIAMTTYATYLEYTKINQGNEIKQIEEKLKQNQNSILSNIAKKNGQKKVESSSNLIQDWASMNVFNFLNDRVQKLRINNELIQKKILVVHNLLEKYSSQTKRLNRDTGHELQLIQEIEDIHRKLSMLQIRYQEVFKASQIIQNQYESTLKSYECDDKALPLQQNGRAIDFEEHSIDILSKIKSDYEESKIVFDKCKDLLLIFKKTLFDERKL